MCNSVILTYIVIRDAVPDEQLDEYKKAHPAREYIHVVRVGPSMTHD